MDYLPSNKGEKWPHEQRGNGLVNIPVPWSMFGSMILDHSQDSSGRAEGLVGWDSLLPKKW